MISSFDQLLLGSMSRLGCLPWQHLLRWSRLRPARYVYFADSLLSIEENRGFISYESLHQLLGDSFEGAPVEELLAEARAYAFFWAFLCIA